MNLISLAAPIGQPGYSCFLMVPKAFLACAVCLDGFLFLLVPQELGRLRPVFLIKLKEDMCKIFTLFTLLTPSF